jgi:hypothetical protein
MARRVKDFIEVGDYTSLDRLITTLQAIRDTLPHDSEPELKLRGDDVFGRRISICYMRELTDEEAKLEGRYAPPTDSNDEIEDLREQLDDVPFERRKTRAA